MNRFIFRRAILLLTVLSLNTRADVSDWFVELDSTNGFYASAGVPERAVESLKKAQKENVELKSFAFTPNGEWVVLDDKGFTASSEEMTGYPQFKANTKCVAYAPAGPWIILYRGKGFWGPGSPAWLKVQELNKSGHEVRSITFGPGDGFVALYDKTGISYGSVPADLTNVLDRAVSNNVEIQCVAFSGQDWICLSHDDWWANNTNLPAAKIIDQNFKLGLHPKWIAFVPNLGPFNPRKFGSIIRETMAGKLAGGYECEVVDRGKVVVALADGWARAPWEPQDPSVKMTVNKPIEIASVSKTITAVAMLKLWEECAGTSRQFSLDEPFWPHISAICPDVNEDVKKITVRQVLAHRGGFTNDFGNNPAALKRLLALPLPHPPGTVSHYLNVDYYIIHLLIAKIGQMDYSVYVKAHVLAPMGITDMETHSEDRQRMCFYSKPGRQDSGDEHHDNSAWAGPGGWYASAADMGKFLEGIRQNKVLHPETSAMMLREKLGWDSGSPWTKGGLANGSNDRHIHTAIAYFTDGVGAVILVNCEHPEPPNAQWLLVQAWKDAHGK